MVNVKKIKKVKMVVLEDVIVTFKKPVEKEVPSKLTNISNSSCKNRLYMHKHPLTEDEPHSHKDTFKKPPPGEEKTPPSTKPGGRGFDKCGGYKQDCNAYQKWNASKCSCEEKNYCSQGCPAGQALHPDYDCKCVSSYDDAIPTSLYPYDSGNNCPADHTYDWDTRRCIRDVYCY